MNSFTGKTVVITGASSGIGRLTALCFAKQGAKLGLIARSRDGLGTLAAEVKDLGGRSYVFPMDVTDAEGMKRAADHIAQEFGGIDIWINNAGTSIYGLDSEISLDDFKRVMDVNFYGQIYGARAALPHLEKSSGQLIGILSVESEIGVPFSASYSASKHALYGYYKSLYTELLYEHSNVKLSTILPSSFATPLFKHAKTQLGVEPAPIPPTYHPQLVVNAIMKVCEKPRFSTVVGGFGKNAIFMQRRFPETFLHLQSWYASHLQKTSKPKTPDQPNNLYDPVPGTSNVFGGMKPSRVANFMETGGKWIVRGLVFAGVVALFERRRRILAELEGEGLTIPMPMSGYQPAPPPYPSAPPAATGDEMNPEVA
ncbi:MAG: SDR family oxidoreductase [Bdellovibrionia bacterium]